MILLDDDDDDDDDWHGYFGLCTKPLYFFEDIVVHRVHHKFVGMMDPQESQDGFGGTFEAATRLGDQWMGGDSKSQMAFSDSCVFYPRK